MRIKQLVVTSFLFLLMTAGAGAAVQNETPPEHGAGETLVLNEIGGAAVGSMNAPKRGAAPDVARAQWSGGAEGFIRDYVARRGAAGTESFRTRRVLGDELGQVHVRVAQTIGGLPVVGAEVVVHAEAASGRVLGVNGRVALGRGLSRFAAIGANAALARAMTEYGIGGGTIAGPTELAYIVDERGMVRLAWTAVVTYRGADGDEADRIFSDARTGAALDRHPEIMRAKNREIYDCRISPCSLVITEGGSSTDPVAMSAYNHFGTTYNYYSTRFGRDSYDAAGGVIRGYVHYGTNYNNAFYQAPRSFFFGDGDGTGYLPFAQSLDVVAHEFTHAVTRYTANLVYANESGAINESISDIYGAAAEAYALGGITPSVWKIGDEIYTPGISGDAFRYMNDPQLAGNVDYYPTRYTGSADNGGVHNNSGIQNLAFYLLVQGGQTPRGPDSFFVAAQGLTKAEKIFYRALTVYATSSTNFRMMRDHTLQAAADLYGVNSSAHTAVWNMWAAVGNHWLSKMTTLATVGDSYTSASDNAVTAGRQTGYLFGPGGSNFNLYLEKYEAGVWTVKASGTTTAPNEVVIYNGAPGQYRWRVTSATGTGTFNLYTNAPY
jgi:Zn-dependent metalloprotease